MKLILETERLILRPFELSDAESLINIKCYPNSIALKGHLAACTIDERIFNIKMVIAEYKEYHIGRLAVINKENNDLIGWAGLRYNPDFFGNDIKGFCDFDFSFKKNYNNAEYLDECLNEVIPHAFEKINIDAIYTKPIQKNQFEYEVYSKLNSKEIGYNYETNSIIFRITKNETYYRNRETFTAGISTF